MTSTLIQPVADRIGDVLEAIASPGFQVPRKTDGGVAWAPQALGGTGPWAVIEIPDVDRTGLDERERELGSDDWTLSFDVTLYFDFQVLDRDQTRAVDLLEAFIAAIDDSDGLGIATLDDVKVVSATKAYDLSIQDRPLLAYECAVEVLLRNPS